MFNTQKAGVWFLLFPRVSPYLGGYAGLVGLLVWFGLGLWQASRGERVAAGGPGREEWGKLRGNPRAGARE